ncbi:MAG: endonuclease III [Buchnera aphidicola (Periphyllus acericola)]|uniref:endonuclease III n=1 Tax=Buchnera aphidicola TaxID=9 RepID=UPI0030D59A6A|nr:endonuclease III [Buchnera aphidicola (Periphyllus acericola)]
MNLKKQIKILSLLKKKYFKKTRTELFYSSDFECLISVMLSAQSRDFLVNKVTKNLFNVANNPEKIVLLGRKKLQFFIKKIGLFRIKSKNIFNTCCILLNKYNSKIPSSRKILESLPGVGRKTSNLVLNLIFNKKTIAVDTHVFRVCNRTGFAIGKSPIVIERILLKVIPNNLKLNVHSFFLLHGKKVCTAKKIKCNICILYKLCEFKNKL